MSNYKRLYVRFFSVAAGVCLSFLVLSTATAITSMTECLDDPTMYWDQQTDSCTSTQAVCSDPDGGKDYYDRAHTFGWHSWHTDDRERRIRSGGLDACIGDVLREHYCYNEDIYTEDVTCPYGCEDGVCLESSAPADGPPIIQRIWVTQKPYCESKSWTDDPDDYECSRGYWVWVDVRKSDGSLFLPDETVEVRYRAIPDERVEYGLGNLIGTYWYNDDRSKTFFAVQKSYPESLLPDSDLYRFDVTYGGQKTEKFIELTFDASIPQTSEVDPYADSPVQEREEEEEEEEESDQECPEVLQEELPDGCRYTFRTKEDGCRYAYAVCEEDASPEQEDQSDVTDSEAEPEAGFEQEVNITNPFSDVDPQTSEGKAAIALFDEGIIGGFPDGEFKGWRLVNRAEASKFLLNGIGADVGDLRNGGRFSDVKEGEWYVRFVMKAADLSIIFGDDGRNTFRPADQVNTAEFLAMLSRAFNLPQDLSHGYTDVSPSDWFQAYAGIAWKYDLFPGRGTLLQPSRQLTRNEVAYAIDTIRKMISDGGEDSSISYHFSFPESSISMEIDIPKEAPSSSGTVECFGDVSQSVLSPDEQWIAIAIHGAAHDCGWLYHIPSKGLTSTAVQYGGTVRIDEWSADSRFVTFVVTTPKPEEKTVIVDTAEL